MIAVGTGQGKVILLGEHGVVYGRPALVMALPLGIRVEVRDGGPRSHRSGSNGELEAGDRLMTLEGGTLTNSAISSICRAAFGYDHGGPGGREGGGHNGSLTSNSNRGTGENLEEELERLVFRLSGNLPAGQGLGSSAALSVATAKAIYAYMGGQNNRNGRGSRTGGPSGVVSPPLSGPISLKSCPRTRETELAYLKRLALIGENLFHKRASGIDVEAALSLPGQSFVFRRHGADTSQEPSTPCWSTGRVNPLSGQAPFELMLIFSGLPARKTADMVSMVARRLKENQAPVERILDSMGNLVVQGTRFMEEGDLDGLGRLMDENQILLRELGVSEPVLDDICQMAVKYGAKGAKLTGAGGGGVVVALFPAGSSEADIFQTHLNRVGLKYSRFPVECVPTEGTPREQTLIDDRGEPAAGVSTGAGGQCPDDRSVELCRGVVGAGRRGRQRGSKSRSA